MRLVHNRLGHATGPLLPEGPESLTHLPWEMDTFSHLGGSGAHNAIHTREITQMLKTTPQRLSPGLLMAPAPHKAAELGNPAHRLAQRRWTCRRRGTVMNGAIQGLPFLDLQQHVTRHVGHCPRQYGGIKHPPSNDAVERQTALQAFSGPQLPRFDAAATFQNPMPHLNAPATGVPRNALPG